MSNNNSTITYTINGVESNELNEGTYLHNVLFVNFFNGKD